MEVLTKAEVEFPKTGTIAQLRQLCVDLVGATKKLSEPESAKPPNPDAHTSAAATAVPDAITDVTTAIAITDVTAATATIETTAATTNETENKVDELEQEITKLKQREILALQREIQQLQGQSHRSSSADFASIEVMVQKFTGDDSYHIRKWFGELEDVFGIMCIDEYMQLLCVRRLLDGSAKLFVRTPMVSDYQSLKAALIEQFSISYSLLDVYEELKARKLRSSESVQRYLLEMQLIASKANIHEGDLLDAVIAGIGDKLGAATMLYQANNLRELKIQIDRYDKYRPRAATGAKVVKPNGKDKTSVQPVATIARITNLTLQSLNERWVHILSVWSSDIFTKHVQSEIWLQR
ncbi:uncharacterized protein [Eurosta solidaginis]|uniref:uncharacterized protein n=1 Tax=Eurosta solidaginis TaxID=178769 RepID=UPI00353128BE